MTSVKLARRSECLRWSIDDTYPASLYPIVGQDEFKASIVRINLAYAPSTWMYAATAAVLGTVIVGFILFIVGILNTMGVASSGGGFHPLVIVGFGVFASGAIGGGVSRCLINSAYRKRLLQAVAVENEMYYGGRLPPIQFKVEEEVHMWRSYNRRGVSGGGSQTYFNIIVEVGALVAPVQVIHQHMYYQPQPQPQPQPQYYPPPSYQQPPQAYQPYAPQPPAHDNQPLIHSGVQLSEKLLE
jgi:hypothetical protein